MVNSKVLHEDTRTISTFNKGLSETFLKLKEGKYWTLVPTDKTNRWLEMRGPECVNEMDDHITNKYVEIDTKYLKEV